MNLILIPTDIYHFVSKKCHLQQMENSYKNSTAEKKNGKKNQWIGGAQPQQTCLAQHLHLWLKEEHGIRVKRYPEVCCVTAALRKGFIHKSRTMIIPTYRLNVEVGNLTCSHLQRTAGNKWSLGEGKLTSPGMSLLYKWLVPKQYTHEPQMDSEGRVCVCV